MGLKTETVFNSQYLSTWNLFVDKRHFVWEDGDVIKRFCMALSSIARNVYSYVIIIHTDMQIKSPDMCIDYSYLQSFQCLTFGK